MNELFINVYMLGFCSGVFAASLVFCYVFCQIAKESR